jgi:hypothetical protein
MNSKEKILQRASFISIASLLNLTVLPGIAFLWLLTLFKQTQKNAIDHYYALLAIKVNVLAAIALLLVSGLMIWLGGFDSPWTWVYVLTYFITVHASFVLFATWILTRAWTGEKLKTSILKK